MGSGLAQGLHLQDRLPEKQTDSGLVNESAHVDVNDQSDAEADDQEGGPTVAQQGKRDTHHRHDPQYHPSINEQLKRNHGHNAKGHQGPEHVLGLTGDLEPPRDEEIAEQQDDEATNETPLLGEHREDKVGVARREKVELALASRLQSLPQELSRPYGDLRLRNVIPCAKWIKRWEEKGPYPLLLIALQHGPEEGSQGTTSENEEEKVLQSQPYQKEQ